jgi:hypothetical protein
VALKKRVEEMFSGAERALLLGAINQIRGAVITLKFDDDKRA